MKVVSVGAQFSESYSSSSERQVCHEELLHVLLPTRAAVSFWYLGEGRSSMSASPQNQVTPINKRGRILIASVGLTLFLLGAVFYALAAFGRIPDSPTWLNVMAMMGSLIALFAWLFPFTAFDGQQSSPPDTGTANLISTQASAKKQHVQVLQDTINPALGMGMCVVFADNVLLVGRKIHLLSHDESAQSPTMTAKEQLSDTKSIKSCLTNSAGLYAATFGNKIPGDYVVWEDGGRLIPITIRANEVVWFTID